MTFSSFDRRLPLAAGALLLGLLAASGCSRSEPAASTTAAPKSDAAPAAKAAATAASTTERVRGRWLRPDGGYQLVIGPIDNEGRAEARYFNPSPINVAWARVRSDAGQIKVEVELRDTNYPGCLYKLTYFPETDRLVGTYFQAQMQQTHEVAFVREQ